MKTIENEEKMHQNDEKMLKSTQKTRKNTQKTVKNEPFFIVPSRVFEMGLGPYELSVLFYLLMRSDNKTHTCFPSERAIAGACGMGVSTVKKVVKQLETKSCISVKSQFAKSKTGLNRQTSNLYEVQLCGGSPLATIETGGSHLVTPPQPPHRREINKTISNITKSNITISNELTSDGAADMEKERFAFCELKREALARLRDERGLSDEEISLLDGGIEYLYFKTDAEYEGRKYTQNELRDLLGKNLTVDVLAHSMKSLRLAGASVRSPVAYLGKCILGGLVRGVPSQQKSDFPLITVAGEVGNTGDSSSGKKAMESQSSFDIDDFFNAALMDTYGGGF